MCLLVFITPMIIINLFWLTFFRLFFFKKYIYIFFVVDVSIYFSSLALKRTFLKVILIKTESWPSWEIKKRRKAFWTVTKKSSFTNKAFCTFMKICLTQLLSLSFSSLVACQDSVDSSQLSGIWSLLVESIKA